MRTTCAASTSASRFAPEALIAKLESARRIVDHEFADALEFSSSEAADLAVAAAR